VDELTFRIGGSSRSHVVVSATRREWPQARDYWDGNWIDTRLEVAAGAFRAEFDAQLRAEELLRFRTQLEALHNKLDGRAKFETMEGWLCVDIEGDGKGHFHADCVAMDSPGVGNRLAFGIDFDQTELPEILRGLRAVCDAFPAVGER
jgi:hypothetical protein